MKKAFILIFSTIAFSLLIESCCLDSFRIVGLGTMTAHKFPFTEANRLSPIDTVNTEFLLFADFDLEIASIIPHISIFQHAYATSCEENFENSLSESSLVLSSDKEFTFEGAIVSPNTNIATLQEVEVEYLRGYGGYRIRINFNDAFLSKANFQHTDYTFNLKIETSDGLVLENEKALFMDL